MAYTSMQDTISAVDGEESDANYTRRQALGIGASAAVAVATMGSASAATATETNETTLNFSSDYVHNPAISGTVVVDDHQPNYGSLDYLADDETRTNLAEHGFVLEPRPDTDTVQAHNPVTLKASDIHGLDDDGNREPHAEFGAFPRGTTWDDDSDPDTAEVDVSALDATHYATTGDTNGTISVTDGANGALSVSTSSVASGETVTATFDLSTVGSSDATIGSPSRKFIQAVVDMDTLTAGATVELAAVDSTDTSVSAKFVAGGDSSLVDVVGTSTGDAQVVQVRVGELETEASTTLEDIQKLEFRVKEADASMVVHGMNLERAETWKFGQQEVTTTEDGDTVLETEDVVRPSGTFDITDLATLSDTVFSNAGLASVTYAVEQQASELPDDMTMARVKEAPDAYDRTQLLEVFHQFESPSAYALDVNLGAMNDTVVFPSGRYTEAGASASLASEPEDWEDVEDVTFTDTRSSYDSVGTEIELLASVSSSDMAGYTVSNVLSEEEVKLATGSGSDGVAVVGSGGGGGGGSSAITALTALLGTLAVLGRNKIRAVLGMFK